MARASHHFRGLIGSSGRLKISLPRIKPQGRWWGPLFEAQYGHVRGFKLTVPRDPEQLHKHCFSASCRF